MLLREIKLPTVVTTLILCGPPVSQVVRSVDHIPLPGTVMVKVSPRSLVAVSELPG